MTGHKLTNSDALSIPGARYVSRIHLTCFLGLKAALRRPTAVAGARGTPIGRDKRKLDASCIVY